MIARQRGHQTGVMSTFPLGHLQVRRSGYGAMQLAGSFATGTPPDQPTAIGVLRAAVAAGVDHIDTSPVVLQVAARLGVTPAQVALKWLLRLAPNVLLIPGTGDRVSPAGAT
jgi:aryl-alcohol dehydrogenase-like predicted oxidoreductase